MSPCVAVLLMFLLAASQALPLFEEPGPDDLLPPENLTVDISTKILASNNGSDVFLLEGDLLPPKTRNAILCLSGKCFWSKSSAGLVTVPYTIAAEYTIYERFLISAAMQAFQSYTCVRFVPRRNENDYISIENQSGCFSSLGRQGGKQVVSLNRQGCVYYGIIQHEINHALGFQHEQTRSDRDSYVQINWANMDQSMAYNFQKQVTNNLNTPYDYSSVMHYGRTAFSINGKDTITPIPDSTVQIGQRQGLSYWDVKRINLLYNC